MAKVRWWIDGTEARLIEALKTCLVPYVNTRFACYEKPDYDSVVNSDTSVVCYGSIQFCNDFIRRSSKLYPGPIATFENYKCSTYYPKFGNALLNSEYAMLPFGDLVRNKEWIYSNFGIDKTIFIRPDSGCKEFTGQLVYEGTFEKDLSRLGFYDVQENLICLISSPKKIQSEYRLFVSNSKIIAGSSYMVSGKVQQNQINPSDFAEIEKVLSSVNWSPDPIYVVDVCFSDGLKILEIGAFSCSGLYETNLYPLISEINNIALSMRDSIR